MDAFGFWLLFRVGPEITAGPSFIRDNKQIAVSSKPIIAMYRRIIRLLLLHACFYSTAFAWLPTTVSKRGLGHPHSQKNCGRFSLSKAITTTTLCMVPPNATMVSNPIHPPKQQIKQQDWLSKVDMGGVVVDLCALLVAFELAGLLDAINAADFVAKGGWFQPPQPLQDSTMPILVQRYSLNSILWLAASATTSTAQRTRDNPTTLLLTTLGAFATLRLCATFVVTGEELSGWYGFARDVYFVTLAVGTARWFQGKLFRT